MSDTPLVSVIIPTYNRRNLIEGTIESVLSQTYNNFELIIVDDGSTDGTKSVVEKIDDRRITYRAHKKNRGANAARNTGLKSANGEYIAFIDSDVVWLPEKIEKQVKTIQNTNNSVGAIYCDSYGQFENYLKEVPLPEISGNIYKDLLGSKIFIPTSQLLFKSECFDKCGNWDIELPCFNEYDLCLRIAQEYNFSYLSRPLVININHDETSISRDIEKRIAGTDIILEKWGNEMEKYHGKNAKAIFRKKALEVSYRTATIWNAKQGRHQKSLQLAYKHFVLSKSVDINMFASVFLTMVNQNLYNYIKKIQYKRSGIQQSDIINFS